MGEGVVHGQGEVEVAGRLEGGAVVAGDSHVGVGIMWR